MDELDTAYEALELATERLAIDRNDYLFLGRTPGSDVEFEHVQRKFRLAKAIDTTTDHQQLAVLCEWRRTKPHLQEFVPLMVIGYRVGRVYATSDEGNPPTAVDDPEAMLFFVNRLVARKEKWLS